jgi:phosphocarrier protein
MVAEREFKIKNKLGLHARAAAQFVKTANRFTCDVKVSKDRTNANGKSIMGVLTLAAAQGNTIKVICEGHDATEALESLESLINAKFGEE